MNLSFSFFTCLLAAILAVALSTTTTTVSAWNIGCEPFFVGNRLVHPEYWQGVSSPSFTINNNTAFVGINLCSSLFTLPPTPNNSNPSSAYIMIIPSAGSPYPQLAFDYYFGGRTDSNGTLISKFGDSSNATYFVRVRTTCNEEATTLRAKTNDIGVYTDAVGTWFDIQLEIRDMCQQLTTTAPPATTQPPATTLPASRNCSMVEMDGFTFNPNSWSKFFYSFLDVPGTGSSTAVVGQLCNIQPYNTVAPGFPTPNTIPGYFNIATYGSVFQPRVFNERQREEVNSFGRYIKYRYTSTVNLNDDLLVYVRCDPLKQEIGFASNELTNYNNTKGGMTFEFTLGIAELCKQHSTTFAPGSCAPFVDARGFTINPSSFPPARGILKNLFSGEAVTAMISPCSDSIFTSPPSGSPVSFQPGYFILIPFDHDDWPQVSFDRIESATYVNGFRPAYRIVYRTSYANHTEDRATVRISCGGRSNALSFTDKFLLPTRNPFGGMSYQVEMATQMMCDPAPTSAAPMPPGTTQFGTTTSAPLPPQTTGAPAPPVEFSRTRTPLN